MRPEVSVVIPTHNRRHRVGVTVAGALAQEDVDLEVIVVDDCSTDGTADFLAGIGDPRLRVLRNEVNRRQAYTRNRGIAEARGVWIAFLDDDDLWAPDKLAGQLRVAAAEGCDIAFSAAVLIDEKTRVLSTFHPSPPARQPADILTRYTVPAGCSNLIVRADLLRQVGAFDERLDTGADWDLFIRLLLARPAAVTSELHVGYVQHATTVSTAHLDRQFEDFEHLRGKHAEARRRYGVSADGVQFSRWLASGLRRGGNRRDAMRAYFRGAIRYRSPGNVVRGLGVLLGERAMTLGRPREEEVATLGPDWLDLYRPGGRLARWNGELGGGPPAG